MKKNILLRLLALLVLTAMTLAACGGEESSESFEGATEAAATESAAAEGVATEAPASGGSGYAGGADEILQANTMEGVMAYESSQYNCADVSLISGEISAAPDAAGAWAELWQVSACGTSHNFAITFTPTADGGTDYAITLAE